MRRDQMLHLGTQYMWKSFYAVDRFINTDDPHHNVSEQLSVVGVIILRELGKLFDLSNVVQGGCGQQKIPLQFREHRTVAVTQLHNLQRML